MKNRMIAVCSAILFVLALGVIAQAQAPARVAGAWVMTYQGLDGAVTATLTLTQDGDALKGSMKAADGTETQLDGATVSGNGITFSVTRTGLDGNPQKVEYKGTVAGDAITGSFQRGQNSADWTAKRQ